MENIAKKSKITDDNSKTRFDIPPAWKKILPSISGALPEIEMTEVSKVINVC